MCMSTKYAQFIKTLRLKRGFTQAFVAEKLGLSRQSYMTIERGTSELKLEGAVKICDLFAISVEELFKMTEPQYEKYKQMILAFLKSPVSADGKVPKTKLAKQKKPTSITKLITFLFIVVYVKSIISEKWTTRCG